MAVSERMAIQDLLESLLGKIVAHPQAMGIVAEPCAAGTRFHVLVDPRDTERLRGREDATVRALRTILRAAEAKHGHEYSLVLGSHP